jgi:TonB family protein
MRLFQAAALALLVTMALPARAADDRAIKSRVSPVYPELARRMKISGAVILEATVDPEGKVKEVKTINGNRLLATAAEDAVRQWKFAPGPGESTVSVKINFAANQ